ncbi:Hypothetical protein FKW44_022333 [Caligus rogercresseyi]|uniref:Uncharacterized protein n=1 Tax=Caligus rogercresseyi TaxID=217165 RepID=A0A7T8GSN6_CALRO|nr:Hypothetical protein FKW44_022333 [Caligus rogercresseyi]
MGPRVPPNTSGCFGVKNPPMGHALRRTRGVLGLLIPPMGPRVPPNTIGVFWGLQIPRQWDLGFRQT